MYTPRGQANQLTLPKLGTVISFLVIWKDSITTVEQLVTLDADPDVGKYLLIFESVCLFAYFYFLARGDMVARQEAEGGRGRGSPTYPKMVLMHLLR